MQQPAIFMFDAFQRYRDQWQGESEDVTHFESFMNTHADAFERSNVTGHFTGSAWLVSADGARVLLMHYRKLDRWLQPAGMPMAMPIWRMWHGAKRRRKPA